MTEINEAWHVLSDPARRAVYDAQSREPTTTRVESGSRTTSGGPQSGSPMYRTVTSSPVAPAKFPWRFMVGVAAVGIAFVLVNAALTKPANEPAPDNLMQVGSCVEILDNGDVKEARCSDANDGVVADLRAIESICPPGTEVHRDRQGMGNMCIRLTDVSN